MHRFNAPKVGAPQTSKLAIPSPPLLDPLQQPSWLIWDGVEISSDEQRGHISQELCVSHKLKGSILVPT